MKGLQKSIFSVYILENVKKIGPEKKVDLESEIYRKTEGPARKPPFKGLIKLIFKLILEANVKASRPYFSLSFAILGLIWLEMPCFP